VDKSEKKPADVTAAVTSAKAVDAGGDPGSTAPGGEGTGSNGTAEPRLSWPLLGAAFWRRVEALLDDECGIEVAGEADFLLWFMSVQASRPPVPR
jgi:hypothetical protein